MPVRLMPRPAPLEMLTIRPQRLPLHARRHGLRAEERAGEVDVEDRLPVGLADLLERPADLAAHAAGIVDQDVDRLPAAASTTASTAARSLTSSGAAWQVPAPRSRRSRRAHRRRGRRPRRVAPRVGEGLGDRPAEAMRRAGDEDGPAGEAVTSCCMRALRQRARASARPMAAAARSISWISSTRRASERRREPVPAARSRQNRDELGIDLGAPLAHGEIAPDAAECDLAERRLMRDHVVEGLLDRRRRRRRARRPPDRSRRTPPGRCRCAARDGADLARRARSAPGDSAGSASTSAMQSLVSAVANSSAP